MAANIQLPYVGEFIFQEMNDYKMRCITGNYVGCPADFCDIYGIAIPDDTQFLRVRSYARHLHFEYRSYGARVRINVHPLEA